jgi:hypothetical protein
MFMPSARHWQEMQFEPHGFWPVPTDFGKGHALLLKTSTQLLKFIIRGTQIQLDLFCAETPSGRVVGTNLRIFDEAAHPIMIQGVVRHEEEYSALTAILGLPQVPLFLFDELARPVGRFACRLEETDKLAGAELLKQWPSPYAGPWNSDLSTFLDQMTSILDPSQPSQDPPPRFAHLNVRLLLSDFVANQIHSIGDNEVLAFKIGETKEGANQEQQVWHLLVDLFGAHLFHSPRAGQQGDARELCDVLAVADSGLLLIESKSLSILSTSDQQSAERRAKNLRKHISKASDQLVGGFRALSKGQAVWQKNESMVVISDAQKAAGHGMIVLSEMHVDLPWKQIAGELLTLSSKVGVQMHILDLTELRILVGVSRSRDEFLAHLTRRHSIMKRVGSALIRTKLDGPPLP